MKGPIDGEAGKFDAAARAGVPERRPVAWNMSTGEQILEIPAAAGSSAGAGSSSGGGWIGALDAPPEENARVAEESRAAVEAAAPRVE